MTESTLYWIWLTLAYGPANPRKWNFLSKYRSVEDAYEKVASGDLEYVLPQDKKGVLAATIHQARMVLSQCEQNGINVYCCDDPDFPDRLRDIYNPPSVIFTLGTLEKIDESVIITAVGTRNPDEYSKVIAARIIGELAQAGVAIVSGCAAGLDSTSLASAIKVGGRVYSVMPCGLLYDYPKNSAAMKKAVAGHGAMISELFPTMPANPLNFRMRNRILSALGLGTLVLQAGTGSGALSTASFALAQGKDIFCIPPHRLYDDAFAGVTSLLRDGAIPVFDTRDILNEYYSTHAHKLNYSADVFRKKSESGIFAKTAPDSPSRADTEKRRSDKSRKKAHRTVIKPAEEEPKQAAPDLSGLSEDRKKIVEFILRRGVVLFDEIASEEGMPDDLETALTELEMEGIIRSLSGNRYTA